jgi:nitrite reductase/ring-hydroxylating ferredoxin subunit
MHHRLRSETQSSGSAIVCPTSAATFDLAAGDLIIGTQAEPGGEVLFVELLAYVQSCFCHERLGDET